MSHKRGWGEYLANVLEYEYGYMRKYEYNYEYEYLTSEKYSSTYEYEYVSIINNRSSSYDICFYLIY